MTPREIRQLAAQLYDWDLSDREVDYCIHTFHNTKFPKHPFPGCLESNCRTSVGLAVWIKSRIQETSPHRCAPLSHQENEPIPYDWLTDPAPPARSRISNTQQFLSPINQVAARVIHDE